MQKDNLKNETPTDTNNVLLALKWIIRQFGDIWCLFFHDFIMNKHKMHKAYGPEECQKCGRWWSL